MKKNIEISISKKWLNFAEEDYKAAISLWVNKTALNRAICFHAQQYVEKIFKGILADLDLKIPKIHDLKKLSRLCEDNNIVIPIEIDELLFLSSVYIEQRYPTDTGLLPYGEPTNEDAQFVINIIQKIKKWLEN